MYDIKAARRFPLPLRAIFEANNKTILLSQMRSWYSVPTKTTKRKNTNFLCRKGKFKNYLRIKRKMSSQVRQNFHEDCEAAINRQINMELYASYTYLAMVNIYQYAIKNLWGNIYKHILGVSFRPGWCCASRITFLLQGCVWWRAWTCDEVLKIFEQTWGTNRSPGC